MADVPDLYETLEIRYPPPRAPRPPRPPARSPRWHRALGTALLLLLAAALAALGTLYVQSRGELRAARAELAAATDPLWADPDGDTPSAAQLRQDRLGRWLQALALGWRYHRGKIYLFSGQRQPWAAAEAACAVTHAHLASVTSAEEQAYLAREARGGSYWIGLAATGPGGSWRWADGTRYSPERSFWAPGQPDSTDHGQGGGRAVSRSTRWGRGSGMTTTATSASPGCARGTSVSPECPPSVTGVSPESSSPGRGGQFTGGLWK